MSDFIFSRRNLVQNTITKEIQSIYKDDKPVVQEYHGHWGSFGVSKNLYNGFNPYEDNEYIVAVIGGPVLMFRNNSFISDEDCSDGTIAIFQRWLNGEIKWDEDLSGPFVVLILNKNTGTIICFTDLMSFIPVYTFRSSNDFILSTHVDILAIISNQYEIDEVSQIDFILHGVVTYPYTTYKNILQIAPATEHKILSKSNDLISNSYWKPDDKIKYTSINHTAIQLRESIQEYINKIISKSENFAQFISGGEDSRTLSAMLQNQRRDAFIFLDKMNREGETAKKIASIYGAKFKLATRDRLHYLNILPSCSDLVGSGAQYHHAHTYGFHESCKLQSYSAVFGGLLADAMLKGSHIKKIRRTGKIPLIPEVKDKNYSAGSLLRNPLFNKDFLSQLTKRRQDHLRYIKSFRTESAEEWFELWPSSMNKNIANLHCNRRLFRSYEPFMSKDVVKISANIPQNWKLNRKLFHKFAKPLLKPSKYLQHGDGWYPYFSWHLKSIIYPIVSVNRRFKKIVGVNEGNQGPWGEWNIITSSELWLNHIEEYTNGLEILYPALNEKDLVKILNSDELDTLQRVNLLQILYLNVRNKVYL